MTRGVMDPKRPVDRLKFILLGIAFLASGLALDSALWSKWGPTAAVLAGFALVFLFGWIAQRIGLFPRQNNDSDQDADGNRMMTWPMGIAWLVAIISWFPGAEIESAALRQPSRPMSEFTQPMHLKGVIRYVTPTQLTISEITHWTFFGGIVVFMGLVFIQDRKKKNRPKL